jgi:hypothetical protein
MYMPKTYMTQDVLSQVLAEFEWPAPYTLEDWLPDGIAMIFPKCTLFFVEGFESEMILEFLLPEDTGLDKSVTLKEALLAISPDRERGAPPTPGLIRDFSPHASLDAVKIRLRNLCTIVLTHFQACILGDFSWVERYKAYYAHKQV